MILCSYIVSETKESVHIYRNCDGTYVTFSLGISRINDFRMDDYGNLYYSDLWINTDIDSFSKQSIAIYNIATSYPKAAPEYRWH